MTFETVEQYIKRSPDPYKARLQMIWDIGYNYDNCKTNESIYIFIRRVIMFEQSIQWLEEELKKAINESRFSDMEYITYILERLRYE